MKSERRNLADFPAQILVCNRMRVLCDESYTHPLAVGKTKGKSIASMSAEEFSRLLDVASPEELNALAGTGGQEKATSVSSLFATSDAFRQLCRERASSPGAVGWGAPMHYLLLSISWLLKPSSLVTAGCTVAFLLTVTLGYAGLRWAICQDYGTVLQQVEINSRS